MKHEVMRFQNVMIRQGRVSGGPFFLRINRGKMSGVIIGEPFEKELITDLFSGRSELEGGYFFYHEELIPPERQKNVIRKKLMREVAIISDESRLFESLSIVDNIFIPDFLIRTPKQKRIARELMAFFDLRIPLTAHVRDLSTLERIQVEILHAVANHHKLIFAVNINGRLRTRELQELYRLYDALVGIGYAICMFEPHSTMPLDKLDYVTVVEKGKCVGEYFRGDIDSGEIAELVNSYSDPYGYTDLIALRDKKLYSGTRLPIMEFRHLSYGKLADLTMQVHKGELVQLFCRTRSDYTAVRKLLTGQTAGFEGELIINGDRMNSAAILKAARKWKIGWMDFSLTDRMLFDNLDLIENICYPLCRKTPLFFLSRKNSKAVREYIIGSELMIDPDADVRTLTQQQAVRVVLSKWLVCKPKLLFLFVPASFERVELDPALKKILLELGMYGIPVLIISERYKLEADIIETEYVLSDGRIVRRG